MGSTAWFPKMRFCISPVRRLEDAEELDFDGPTHRCAVGMAERGDAVADYGVDAELLLKLAGKGALRGFAELDFAAGELPLEGHGLVGAALADKNFTTRLFFRRVFFCRSFSQDEGRDDVAQRLGCGLRSAAIQFTNGFLHV